MQGAKISESLRALIAPYFLRREKSAVMAQRAAHLKAQAAAGLKPALHQQPSDADAAQAEADASAAAAQPGADSKQQQSAGDGKDQKSESREIQKNDFILWMRLSAAQVQLYRAFVSTEEVKIVLNSTKSPLAALTVLKKVRLLCFASTFVTTV